MVYFIAADGFEELELVAPLDLLRRAGIECLLLSASDGLSLSGAHGIVLTADASLDAFDAGSCEAVVLPGGSLGVKNLAASEAVGYILDAAAGRGAIIGAICAAPSILQRRGLLDGRDFTCFPGCADKTLGGSCTGRDAEVSGNIITSKAAGTAVPFAAELIAALRGREAADAVLSGIFYR